MLFKALKQNAKDVCIVMIKILFSSGRNGDDILSKGESSISKSLVEAKVTVIHGDLTRIYCQ